MTVTDTRTACGTYTSVCARTNEAFMLLDMNVTTISLERLVRTAPSAGVCTSSGCILGEYVKTGLSDQGGGIV